MDSAALKTYHREIGHLVFDANEKVSVRKISNLWNIDSQQSVEVLQKWIDDQKEPVKLSLEFLIRGKDKNGNVFMTLANEKRAAKITSKYAGCSKMLYSVEATSDVRPLNVSSDRDFAVIKLRLETEKRELAKRSLPTAQPAVAAVKQEQKPSKMNGLFGAMASKQAKTPAVAKEEKPSSPPPAPVVPTVKPEPQTPTTKASPKKASPKKESKKQTNGKGSISSFFSSKPGQTAASKPVVKPEPESPSNVQSTKKALEEQKKPEQSRKRTIDEDEEDEVAIKREREDEREEEEIPNTPQEEKREAKKRRTGKPLLQRKAAVNPSKKSRIYAICDSSSEDEVEATEKRREEERLVKFEQDPEPEADPEPMQASTISPEKPVENDSNSVNRNHRGKVKKLVTRTFMSADGFMETVKEYEMVSEDEFQGAPNGEQSLPVDTKLSAPSVKQVQAEPSKKEKNTPPTPRSKQGSIMSFFAKK
uniref:DNA polymerase delta subunit 3 n=1 Tax=Anopheles marajoara TaxID=58244 RepID=A0A2M4BM14_9DIPT